MEKKESAHFSCHSIDSQSVSLLLSQLNLAVTVQDCAHCAILFDHHQSVSQLGAGTADTVSCQLAVGKLSIDVVEQKE